jgi:transcriptional regulator with XRE-family HTH domain
MPRASERQVTALSTGERIRLYRIRRGLSRERLSGLAGVSPSWLEQVENGTRKADSLRLLVAVAEAQEGGADAGRYSPTLRPRCGSVFGEHVNSK